MLKEIRQIPEVALQCHEANRLCRLPLGLSYLGIGSSYFAPLVLKYCDVPIQPEPASEYIGYLTSWKTGQEAVLISQSGRSSELLWCADTLDRVSVITNDPQSPLARHPHATEVIHLAAGEEKFSSSKTYINTLIALYLGFGFDPMPAIRQLEKGMGQYENTGERWSRVIHERYISGKWKGAYILGNGPNLGTAMQAALVLTESSGIPFQAMSLAQFDHGPKESAPGSLVFIISTGSAYEKRRAALVSLLQSSGGHIVILDAGGIAERLSPLTAIMPFFFACHYLAGMMNRNHPFVIGGKVTETS